MKTLLALLTGCAMLAPSIAAAKPRTTITSYQSLTRTTHTTIRTAARSRSSAPRTPR